MPSPKKNFIYNSLYELLLIAVPLITTPYLARILGPKGLGEYSYAYAIAYYFVLFIQLGMKNYGTREIAKYQHKLDERSRTFWELLSLQLICAGVVIAAYLGYTFYFSSNRLMSILLLPYVISGALDITWCFSGLENFKIIVGRSTVIKILTTACIFLFVKSPDDVTKYACIMTGGMLLNQILLWPFLLKYISLVPVIPSRILVHIKSNLILFVPVLAISIYKMMGKIMLGYMTDMSQVGFYESSERILVIPLALITSLGTVMLPHMSNLYSTSNSQRAKIIFEKSIYFAMFLATSIGFGMMAVSKTFVPWFYGTNFMICITLFKILLPSSMFLAFANVIRTQYLIPKERDFVYVSSVIAGAVVNIVINFCLIPSMGAVGAAIGTLCAEVTVCIMQASMVYKEIPIKQCIIKSIPFILAGIGMYFFVIHLHFLSLPVIFDIALQVIIGIFCYFTIVSIFIFLFQKKYGFNYVSK